MAADDTQDRRDRREEILDAACEEFAQTGLHGTSTDAIARRAGISQPYLFRLFGTKKELFIATVQRCFAETLETFAARRARQDGRGRAEGDGRRLHASSSPTARRLQAQMQAYAACDDPEVCAVVREGYGRLVELVERRVGRRAARVRDFFAVGMLLERDRPDGPARLLRAVGEAAARGLPRRQRAEADLFFDHE